MRIVLLGTPELQDMGKYSQLLVKYQADGKNQERKVMSFTYKDVYNLLKTGQEGDAFDIKLEKGEKYWNWVEAKPAGKGEVGMPSASLGSGKGGNWETPEERAKKQVYIVRQSSISNAIEYYKANMSVDHTTVTVGSIIEVAKEFENYVFGNSDPAEVE